MRTVRDATVDDAASAAFHRAMGCTDVGVMRRIGWKHGAWHDVAWVQRDIGPHVEAPTTPSPE